MTKSLNLSGIFFVQTGQVVWTKKIPSQKRLYLWAFFAFLSANFCKGALGGCPPPKNRFKLGAHFFVLTSHDELYIIMKEVKSMSYETTNTFPIGTNIERVKDVIKWLDYEIYDGFEIVPKEEIPQRKGSYVWVGAKEFQSLVGLELTLYEENGVISVCTRTRIGRSYWEHKHQHETVIALSNFFGGEFEEDDWDDLKLGVELPEKSEIEVGLYYQKWIFDNNIKKVALLEYQTRIEGNNTNIPWLMEFNANTIFNNLLIPYIVGAWEKYLKSTFVVLLKFADDRKKAFKKVINKIKILPQHIETFSQDNEKVEWVLSEWLSFQRPKSIIDNYKMVNENLDINAVFSKPIPARSDTLLDSIDDIITIRNAIVHAAEINIDITDEIISSYISDICNAVEGIYRCIGNHYGLDLENPY
ncbi:MAG: hypothetical protein LBM38_01040 [Clostridiales bacterium]|jgi:hypothetical protein|nr:hypothetical protein [Clostridiales bacterium]